jgi:serine/threonine protein kinase
VEGVDKACDAFETAWKAAACVAQRPRIEDYLSTTPESVYPALLHELIALEIAYRRRAGEDPEATEYCNRFPKLDRKQLAIIFAAEKARGPDVALTRSGQERTRVDFHPEAAIVPPSDSGARGPSSLLEFVGGYRLLRPLGQGGMGTVYEAEHADSGRHVALKLISPQFVASKDAVERFRQEGRLASTLVHPRCVFILAADEDQGRPYIVMELMPGNTLDSLVKKHGPLPPEEALRKILDVIDGLKESHQFGLVHRDVKPSNCFLEADGRVKIGDFGLAKSLLRPVHLTHPGTFLGTPLFAAPEQIKKEQVDTQSDLYSVAATLYFLLTGQAPFQTSDPMATMARIVSEDPPSMRKLRPELPKDLDKVVLRGLERDRKRRWRSLDEFRQALLLFLPAERCGSRAPLFRLSVRRATVVYNGVPVRSAIGQAPGTRSPSSDRGLDVRCCTVPRLLRCVGGNLGLVAGQTIAPSACGYHCGQPGTWCWTRPAAGRGSLRGARHRRSCGASRHH